MFDRLLQRRRAQHEPHGETATRERLEAVERRNAELEGKYARASEEYAAIMDLTVEEFFEHYPSAIEDIASIHPDDRERYRVYDAAYKANHQISQIEYRMIRSDGEIVHVRELMHPMRDNSGRVIQTLVTNQDITEEKLIEEQLRQAQKMEAVGQLTGGIAHDFNNLLAVIPGNLEVIEAEVRGSRRASESLLTAVAAAERGASLTQRLLAFSRKPRSIG